MLRKLFKHDMRALSRWMRFVVLGIVGLSLFLTVFALANFRMDFDTITTRIVTVLAVFSTVGLYVSLAVTAIFIYIHYYRSMFSDEGYLTHTLPARGRQILFSKLLSSLLWQLICGAALLLGVFLILSVTFDNIFYGIVEAFRFIREELHAATVALALVDLFALGVSGLLQIFLAITIGCAIANKHRVWAAIGIYVAINMGNGIVNSIFYGPSMIVMLVSSLNDANIISTLNIVLLIDFIKNCGIAVACFFWSNHLIQKRLNLQ